MKGSTYYIILGFLLVATSGVVALCVFAGWTEAQINYTEDIVYLERNVEGFNRHNSEEQNARAIAKKLGKAYREWE